MSAEVPGDSLGDEFKGYIFRISGGNDKQGFPMKQGVLTQNRVRLLFKDGMSCYRIRRKGERKRKSVRGCIVSHALSVMNLVIVKKGDNEIAGLTDQPLPKRLGPKRANKIRKLFNIPKNEDVRKFVIRREAGKKMKAPKIQRLVTKSRLQRKRYLKNTIVKKVIANREEKDAYEKRLGQFRQEQRLKRAAELAKKKEHK